MKSSKRPKVGLALGSGGAKGLAHVGILRVLVENHIPIDYIAGSSAGAIVGGLYAALKDIDEVERLSLSNTWRQIMSLLDPTIHQGLIGGEKMKNFLEEHMKHVQFKDLQIPLTVIATDVQDGDMVPLNKGDVALAIRASASFPLVFKPVEIGGKLLSDGGLSNPVPVDIVRKMGADVVIAVNLDSNFFPNRSTKPNLRLSRIAYNSFNLLRFHLARKSVEEADIVLNPRTGAILWNKLMDGQDVVDAGEDVARRHLKAIKDLVK